MFDKVFLIANLIIFQISIVTICAAQTLHVITYNTGQGNCVCVSCPQNTSLLIDCGSSEHNHNNRSGLHGPPYIEIARIKEQIINLSQIKPITIIISHLDKDHYNWLYKIFYEDQEKQLIEKIIIIGHESFCEEHREARGDKGKLVRWIDSMLALGKPVTFHNNYNDPALQERLPQCGKGIQKEDLNPTALTSNVCHQENLVNIPECGQNEITNANSLVLKLNHEECQVILPGDALDVTTNDMMNRGLPLNATILLTSHHGSAAHGANSERWINSVRPKIALFSSGKYPSYNHPSSIIANRLAIIPQLFTNLASHDLSYYINHDFNTENTSLGIISTFNSGNIHTRFYANYFEIGNAVASTLLPPTQCLVSSAVTTVVEVDFDFG
jgi:beta-lactamase superfamily II metal-dependent hydrolase